MKVTGIDVGRAHTAVVTYDVSESKVCSNHTIDLPLAQVRRSKSYGPQYYRLSLLGSMLETILKDEDPVLVMVEDYIYGKRGLTVEDVENMDRDPMKVAETHGLVYATIAKCDLPMIKTSPTQMKLFMTGNGLADKRKMIKSVYNVYRVSMPDEHQYDALCAAHIGRILLLYMTKPTHKLFTHNAYIERTCHNLIMDKKFEGVHDEMLKRIRIKSEVTSET